MTQQNDFLGVPVPYVPTITIDVGGTPTVINRVEWTSSMTLDASETHATTAELNAEYAARQAAAAAEAAAIARGRCAQCGYLNTATGY